MSLKLIHIGVFVILVLMSVVHNIEIESNESIFSEISRNISFVNNLLQDLMKKYELLKHLTHTETDEISHNPNKELNEFIKMESHFKIRAKDKIKEPETLSATESYTDKSTEDNVSGIHKKKTLKGKKINHPGDTKGQLGYPLKLVGKTLFFSDESSEKNTNETHYKRTPKEKKVFGTKDSVSSDSQEDTFLTKKSQSSTAQRKIKLKENIKHKKITTPKDYKYLDDEILKDNQKESEDTGNVKKVLVIHLDSNKSPNVNQLRTSNPNEVKIPSEKNKQRTTESTTHMLKLDNTDDSNSDLEDHKAMQEVISRAHTLREALGDACILLVIKKCKKALKNVLKDICKKDRKCASNFNNDFTENGIAACDEEFNKPNGKPSQNVRHDKYFRDYDNDDSENDDHGQDDYEELTGAKFVDYTRQGLLDMTCLQAISDVKKPKMAERTNLTNIDAKTHDVHILRGKLENACRKTSFDKCNKACKSARDKTCKKHECVSAKKKALGKSCKKRCMESYGYQEKSSSESDSDEDSDEGSNSDESI
ncbi:SWI/SNF-related matrix-associated actin-dependent regulator of chromatin subfamily A containing DEAD/H box 1-like [Cydia amplana]|uniref:SWI/SNF-related matrix-associated actin-dependent regulator of chromatin subfamily A containing DEAD/H box 1-like n=1 Tax=Cydia amplana TaxID=1869771 RepID=UPI002FE6A31A